MRGFKARKAYELVLPRARESSKSIDDGNGEKSEKNGEMIDREGSALPPIPSVGSGELAADHESAATSHVRNGGNDL